MKKVISAMKRCCSCFVDHYVFKKNYSFSSKINGKNKYKELTAEQKKEIDSFWAQYGIKYPDYSWFKMYYGATGIIDPTFIPHPIAHTLIKKYNVSGAIGGWDDKNVYELLVPNVKFPESLAHYIHGKYYDSEWKLYDSDVDSQKRFANKIFDELCGDDSIIVKKTTKSAFGKGVQKTTIKNNADVFNLLESLKGKEGFILQKCIKQHRFLAQFNETSVNVFRVITFRSSSGIHFLSASLRFGIDGQCTDVAFIDGEEIVNVVGVDSETGKIKEVLYDVNGEKEFTKLADIKDRTVPCFGEMVKTAVEGHSRLLHFDFVGWDFTIDDKGQIICVEYNIVSPGTQLYQFAHGPLLGKYVEEYLEPLKAEEVRAKIPRKFKMW